MLALLRQVGALSGSVDEGQLERIDAALRKRSSIARARGVLEVLRGRDGVRPELSEARLTALVAEF